MLRRLTLSVPENPRRPSQQRSSTEMNPHPSDTGGCFWRITGESPGVAAVLGGADGSTGES